MTRRLAPLAALLLLVAACDGGLSLGGAPQPSASPSASPSATPSGSPTPGASGSPGAASPTPDPRLPTEAPTLEGEVLSIEPASAGQLHVARIHVASADGGNQAVATLLSSTAVWRAGAGSALTRVSTAELHVGQQVRVWAGGPVRESFPIQFDAKAVVILP